MSYSIKIILLLSATSLAATLSGCADNRMDGGYTGDSRTMTRLTAPAQPTPSSSQIAQNNSSPYVYRGGRDPVTGKASLSY
jgi:hypothetical protein